MRFNRLWRGQGLITMDYAEDYAGIDIPRNEYTENLRLLLLLEEYWGLQEGSD